MKGSHRQVRRKTGGFLSGVRTEHACAWTEPVSRLAVVIPGSKRNGSGIFALIPDVPRDSAA